jgi:hypothetical protein
VFKSKDGELATIKRQGDPTQFGTRLEGFVDPSVTSSGLVYLGGHDDNGEQHLFVFDSGDHSRVPIEAHLDGSAAGRWMPPFFLGTLAVNRRGDLAALGAAPNPDVANGFHQHRKGSGAAVRFRHRENGADFATH